MMLFSVRRNLPYRNGIIHLTPSPRSRPLRRRERASRSSTRKWALPSARATEGSTPSTSVQPAGMDRTCSSPGIRKKTLCSPHVCAYPTSSNSRPVNGWNGWVTVKRPAPPGPHAFEGSRQGEGGEGQPEIEQSFLAWLTGQVLPLRPTILDYDRLAERWIEERVLPRRHRTTQRIVGEAWAEERLLLTPVPAHVLQRLAGEGEVRPVLDIVDVGLRRAGEVVEVRARRTTRWRCDPASRATDSDGSTACP